MRLARLARLIGLVLLAIGMSLVGIWCAVAVWYQCPFEPWRSVLCGATALVALSCIGALGARARWIGFGALADTDLAFSARIREGVPKPH